jgi:hypothetical protein
LTVTESVGWLKQESYGHGAQQQLTPKKIFITQLVANDKYEKETIAQ